ncbi:hypothetical protein N7E70_025115 [Aminobacter sp. NyZ550]|uniref:Uncharacterized protein n=3 Tax=Aminobacter TaxID=31988 RepID=A0AAC9ASS6_AMIAI|nr:MULTISPECIES: hypothetical protein [Aminobacter]AMS43978.1 hypothetical protein AA2016_5070 [Aminobacter aminovorans]MBA9023491.1 hypothetical protein [Aminobacter ciceronei]MBB3705635.1 hypothetical protein [Aminobacter aminovorans]MDR7224638.1 hypothetical protein [Aminobacter aminovorans]WAX94895.1 hypothetical protein N7E70_025115 [Aminobacter sp. NyZ550]
MTTLYELADTKYPSKAISEGYAITAPSYLVAATTKRVPRSIEIRMRRRLDDADGEFLSRVVDAPAMMPNDFATEAFADIEGEDFDIIVQSFSDIIESISEVNCVAYGVEPDTVKRYHEVMANVGGPAHR